MKLTRDELRKMISDEILKEGILDTAENIATTTLSHFVIGDAAALTKALTIDTGRAVSALADLNQLLKPVNFDLIDIGTFGGREEVENVAKRIAMLPQEAKETLRESFLNFGESIKRFVISLISSSPDIAISGSSAAAITAFPVESFFVKAAPLFADFLDAIENIPGGSFASGAVKITTRILAGPLGWLFGDPITTFAHMGILIEATSEHSEHMNTFPTDNIDNEYADYLTENRYRKLAGI